MRCFTPIMVILETCHHFGRTLTRSHCLHHTDALNLSTYLLTHSHCKPPYLTVTLFPPPPIHIGAWVRGPHEAERPEAGRVLHPACVPRIPHPSVPAKAAQRKSNAKELANFLASQNHVHSAAGWPLS